MNQSTLSEPEDNHKSRKPHKVRGCLLSTTLAVVLVCTLATGLSALSNRLLSARIPETGKLSDTDKARLAEAFHLRHELGDALWPGWGQADIPMILYDEAYAFLVGYPDPPPGWVKVPANEMQGGPWEAVQGDSFEGQIYYRQRLSNPAVTPQAFTVLIGDRWVSSLPSREWMQAQLGNELKDELPAFLEPLLPYRFAARLFLSAAGGVDSYIGGLLHESFHAFEGISNPERLSAAETIYQQNQSRYPWDSESFVDDWQVELNLLADAVQTQSDAEAADLTRQFLVQRQKRRTAANLDDALIDLERQKEWEEGLAKYTELSIWRLAAATNTYQPLPAMDNDPGFHHYANADQRWAQETDQIRRMAGDRGDTRFYYSGFAQAALLDRLAPDWKTKILTENVFLEDLLSEAVK